jgi:hypothetical protein
MGCEGGQPAWAYLPASTVVGAFDAGDGRDAELLAGVLPAAVQDVLVQQAEEAPSAQVAALIQDGVLLP